ncbi:hypothetical protein [Pseudodonghicola sp.]|uniref:hypothetical protein n=1 Tax=Pseudodonghicola sp. TaxID=1969463 RepID=UPI003A9700BB
MDMTERYMDKLADLEATPRLHMTRDTNSRAHLPRAERLTAIARREKRLRDAKEEMRFAIPRAVAAGCTRFFEAVAWICEELSTPEDSRDDRFRAREIVWEVMQEGDEDAEGLTRWGAALEKYA